MCYDTFHVFSGVLESRSSDKAIRRSSSSPIEQFSGSAGQGALMASYDHTQRLHMICRVRFCHRIVRPAQTKLLCYFSILTLNLLATLAMELGSRTTLVTRSAQNISDQCAII